MTQNCRMDWHQTGGKVTISIFAKCADAMKTIVKANQVSIDFSVVFGDDMFYADKFELCGVRSCQTFSLDEISWWINVTL